MSGVKKTTNKVTERMQYEMSAHLFIGGFTCTPSEISDRVKVQPTTTSDTPLKRGAKRPEGWQTWSYENKESDELICRTVEECIDSLLLPIADQSDLFAKLPDDWVKEIVVTLFTNDGSSYVQLSNAAMSLISAFRFDLSVALYFICDECEKRDTAQSS